MKEKLTEELIITDGKLAFQIEEKEKRGSELILSTVVDTPERKKDKEYIGHLAAIVESSDDAIISKSLDGIIKSWNKSAKKMFGYTAKGAIGKHISLIIPPEYINEEKKILERIRNNEIIAHFETVRIKKSGERLYVSLTVSPLKDRAGNIIGVSKIARDITEQKKAEENLRKSLSEVSDYKYALEESCIVAITDQKGIIKYANDNFCKISKYNSEELIGQDHRIINSGYHPKEFIRDLWLTIANGKIWRGELKNRAKDQSTYWVDSTIVTFLNENGKTYQYVAIRADITGRKRAEELIIANNEEKEKRAAELIIANEELFFQNEEKEKQAVKLFLANKELKEADDTVRKLNEKLKRKVLQLESVNKDLESFSYSVSHDLRTPLRAVHGYTKMLKEDYIIQLDSEANRLMDNVMHYAKKMGQLIDDLLAFSRLGRKELMKENIRMNDIVSNLCSEIKNEHNLRNIQFKIDELLPAQGDSVAIKQAWINLISNAIKYSKLNTKTVIEIGSEIKEDEIIYHIKDNGVGFDMRYADKLFGVFQRLHSDKEFEGTGVGLAIVHRIISKHGGNVWAEGKVNEGAIFYFSLPKNTT